MFPVLLKLSGIAVLNSVPDCNVIINHSLLSVATIFLPLLSSPFPFLFSIILLLCVCLFLQGNQVSLAFRENIRVEYKS